MLNSFLSFLFLNSKTNARLLVYLDLIVNSRAIPAKKFYFNHYVKLLQTKFIYDKAIRKYLFGLGFFISFIPGTEPFKARIALYDHLFSLSENKGILEFLQPLATSFDYGYCFEKKLLSFPEKLWNTINGNYINIHLHALNIFQYLLRLLQRIKDKLDDSIWVYPSIVCLLILFFAEIILEIVLRTIDTLVFDPIRFIIEEIGDYVMQPFIQLPKQEFLFIDILDKQIVENKKLHYKYRSKRELVEGHIYEKENVLAIVNEPTRKRFKQHKESPYFKMQETIGLFKVPKNKEQLRLEYQLVNNLKHFFVFALHTYLPPELMELIITFCNIGTGEYDELSFPEQPENQIVLYNFTERRNAFNY